MIDPIAALAVVIALLGVLIASGQWYTARQKLALDLFEKRYEALQALNRSILALRSSGTDMTGVFEVDGSVRTLRFLVSKATHSQLMRVADLAFNWHGAEVQVNQLSQRSHLKEGEYEKAVDHLMKVQQEFYTESRQLDELLIPYLRMDQKPPRTPLQWLRDCWHSRPEAT